MFAIPLASLPKRCHAPLMKALLQQMVPPAQSQPGTLLGWSLVCFGGGDGCSGGKLASQVCILPVSQPNWKCKLWAGGASWVLAAGFSLPGMLWMQNAPGVRCELGVNSQDLPLAGGDHTGPGARLPSHGASAIGLCSWLKVPGWPRQRVTAPSPQLLHWDGCGEGKENSSFHWALLGFLSPGLCWVCILLSGPCLGLVASPVLLKVSFPWDLPLSLEHSKPLG